MIFSLIGWLRASSPLSFPAQLLLARFWHFRRYRSLRARIRGVAAPRRAWMAVSMVLLVAGCSENFGVPPSGGVSRVVVQEEGFAGLVESRSGALLQHRRRRDLRSPASARAGLSRGNRGGIAPFHRLARGSLARRGGNGGLGGSGGRRRLDGRCNRGGGGPLSMGAVIVDPQRPGEIYLAGGSRGDIWRGPPRGPFVALGRPGGSAVPALLPDRLNPGGLLAATGWGIYRLATGAQRWELSSQGLSNFDVQRLAPLPGDSSLVLAGCAGKVDVPDWLFLSRDGGQSWSAVDSRLRARRLSQLSWSNPATLEAVAVVDWSGAWRLRLQE